MGAVIKDQRVKEIINEFELDLEGITVATECATGPYSWTGPVAAYAGATEVVCFARASRHGSYEEAVRQTESAAEALGVRASLSFYNREMDLPKFTGPLLVTNSFGIRPLDAAFLRSLPSECVVAAMFEAWELRADDIDMDCANRLGIPVVTVNESHPLLGGIKYVGLLCLKMMHESGVEIADSRVALVGNDPFTRSVYSTLKPWAREIWKFGDGSELRQIKGKLGNFDSLVVADHRGSMYEDPVWADIASELLRTETFVINVSGFPDYLMHSIRRVIPSHPVNSKKMSFTLDYLGFLPVLRLMVGGLTAGRQGFRDLRSRRNNSQTPCSLVEQIL